MRYAPASSSVMEDEEGVRDDLLLRLDDLVGLTSPGRVSTRAAVEPKREKKGWTQAMTLNANRM